jgi:hypothetical protein
VSEADPTLDDVGELNSFLFYAVQEFDVLLKILREKESCCGGKV